MACPPSQGPGGPLNASKWAPTLAGLPKRAAGSSEAGKRIEPSSPRAWIAARSCKKAQKKNPNGMKSLQNSHLKASKPIKTGPKRDSKAILQASEPLGAPPRPCSKLYSSFRPLAPARESSLRLGPAGRAHPTRSRSLRRSAARSSPGSAGGASPQGSAARAPHRCTSQRAPGVLTLGS